MENYFDITNRHILIFGASGGIGRHIAIVLSEMGGRLGLSGRNNSELEKTRSLLSGDGHYLIPADLLELKDTETIFEDAVSSNGKLEGMVYSAGVVPTIPLRATSTLKCEEVMYLNFLAFVDTVRNYSKKKYSDGGSIIGISSIASVRPEKGQLLYAASKASMNASIQVMAQELFDKHIRINAILPGIADSGEISESFHKKNIRD